MKIANVVQGKLANAVPTTPVLENIILPPGPAAPQPAPTLPVPGGVPTDYGLPAGAVEAPVAAVPVTPAPVPTQPLPTAPTVALEPAAPAPAPVLTPAPAPAPMTPGVAPAVGVDMNPKTAPAPAAAPATQGSFLMRGAAAHAASATEQMKADLAQSQSGFRFWLKVGGENRITFVDGSLDQDGALLIPYWYEHRLMIGGRLNNIVCYETLPDAGPCPVCNHNHRTQLVAGLTVINHTPYVIQSGQKAGQTLQHRRQMFVAPRTAIATLQKLAEKRGGLIGHCFDVHRKEAKDARVGSVYDYVGQLTQEQMTAIGEEWKPYNWDEAMKLLTPGEMETLGGSAVPYAGTQGAAAAGSVATTELHDVDL